MKNRLIVHWAADDLGGLAVSDVADCLNSLIKQSEREFISVGVDTELPEPARRRFWQRVPDYSTVGKSFAGEAPTWWIGYNDQGVTLMMDFPQYKKHVVRNQSPLEYVAFGPPRAFDAHDGEREDRALEQLQRVLYRIGLHTGGPNPPSGWEWCFSG